MGDISEENKISIKKIIAIVAMILGMIVLLILVLISFKENGVKTVKDIFVRKIALENAYYLTQILCSFVVIIGGIIGVWQYILAKQAEVNQYQNNRIQKAIDLAEYYKDNILYCITFINQVYEESGLLDILNGVKRSDMKNFDIHELDRNFTLAQKEKISDITKSEKFLKAVVEKSEIFSKEPMSDKFIIKDGNRVIETRKINQAKAVTYFWGDIICGTLNNLEYFSLHFNYGLADKVTVYQSLHQTYLEMVQMLYYDIAMNNKPGEQKLYTNVIELFNDWKATAERQIYDETKFSRNNIVKGSKAKTVE